MTKVTGAPPISRRSSLTKLYVVLVLLLGVVLVASVTNNPFGAYFAAYVSTALVVYGLIDLVRKVRSGHSLSRTFPVLVTGIFTGLFMNMGQVLGWSVYLAFIVGQLFTVVLVVWLMSAEKSEN